MSISLCITSYNKDYSLIYSLLDEFKKQTFPPKEIIFYCSGVDGVNVPNSIFINSNEIPIYTVFSLKRTNQAMARNICSSVASSNYIMFFDVDDIPHPMKLEITSNILNKTTNIDFLLHNYNQMHHRSNSFENIEQDLDCYPINEIDKNSTNVICGDHYIHHAHITVKKSVFEKIKFNESTDYYRREDGKFCQDLVLNGYSGIYYPAKLVNYIV
jgi:glycosyltransferase involved in cell wall biosynthesis